jgi:hypothetical protein
MFQEQIIFGFGDIFNATYRMNVAITRAKELLVVIGNAKILQQDPFWRSFLQFTLRNKLCVSSLSLIPLIHVLPQLFRPDIGSRTRWELYFAVGVSITFFLSLL